jgi:hypothetical protein
MAWERNWNTAGFSINRIYTNFLEIGVKPGVDVGSKRRGFLEAIKLDKAWPFQMPSDLERRLSAF